jgi:alpha-1,3-rhamnosyl/mannosyltransferase
MNSRIKLLVNAIPMVNVNTGISRYLRCLYAEMERLYGDRLEIGYFDGVKVSSTMPYGPANLNRWTKSVGLFWRLPLYPAIIVRLAFHFMREALFRRCSRHYDLYHEAGFFPFAVPRRLKTVFTIHDLSLIRFPQYHPEERVLYSPREAHDDKIFFPRSHEEVKAFLKRQTLPERYFLFVGGGDPRKNLDVVPEALEKAGIEIPLVVVGWSGWSDEKPRKNIIPLGYVSDDDLAGLYSGAIALIFPSSYEGFGLPLLEAMACGCPVVTTREASLPEVAGEAAMYIKGPRDIESLAGILEHLASTPDICRKLTGKGLKRAGEFSWSHTAQTTFQAFERVLGI